MIILFSILLLLILVYIGIKQKEGMTLSDSSSLLTILNKYYKFEKQHKEENINNNRNEKVTMEAINDLRLTDSSLKSVIENKDLNNSSKINMLNTYLKNKIVQTDNSITPDQFNKIASILENVTDLNEQVIEIQNITINDPRFNKSFDGSREANLKTIKNAMINIVN